MALLTKHSAAISGRECLSAAVACSMLTLEKLVCTWQAQPVGQNAKVVDCIEQVVTWSCKAVIGETSHFTA